MAGGANDAVPVQKTIIEHMGSRNEHTPELQHESPSRDGLLHIATHSIRS